MKYIEFDWKKYFLIDLGKCIDQEYENQTWSGSYSRFWKFSLIYEHTLHSCIPPLKEKYIHLQKEFNTT